MIQLIRITYSGASVLILPLNMKTKSFNIWAAIYGFFNNLS